jgi:hypothetical protein
MIAARGDAGTRSCFVHLSTPTFYFLFTGSGMRGAP